MSAIAKNESIVDLLMNSYDEIAKAADNNINPLFKPESPELYDPILKRLMWLNRPLFPKQAEMVAASEEYLSKNKSLLVSSQTGTGKTSMGIALMTNPKVKTAFIEVPSHLLKKWVREIGEVAGAFDFDIVEVKSYKDILPLTTKGERLTRRTVFVGSKDSMKTKYSEVAVWGRRYRWEKSKVKNKTVIPRHRVIEYYCTDCGHTVKSVATVNLGIRMKKLKSSKKEAEAYFAPRSGITHCKSCKQKQTQPDSKRMGAAEYLRRFGRKGSIDLALTDEVHESKSKDSQRAMASAVLIKLSKKYVGLTGTLLGGYASHAFYMLFRMFPRFMTEQMGYKWHSPANFIEEFGGVERHYEIESYDPVTGEFERGRRTFGSKERAELSPRLQDILLPFVAFLRLDEIRIPGDKALPPVTEIKHILEYNEELVEAYHQYCADVIEPIRENADFEISLEQNRVLRATLKGDSLLIPDMPFTQQEVPYAVIHKKSGKIHHKKAVYIPPVTRAELVLTNKEVKLIEIVNRAREANRKVLVYVDFVTRGAREEVLGVLQRHTTAHVEVLDNKISALNREKYIKSLDCDVLITNPELVKTGLDLLEYPTIIFYQQVYTSFNVYTLRQAMMRSWRIGQTVPVEIHTLAYAATQQHTVYKLIASKVNISAGVEGRLSSGEDMASEADESASLLIAKAILENKRTENKAESSSETFEMAIREWTTFERYYLEHVERFAKNQSDYLDYKPAKQPKLKITNPVLSAIVEAEPVVLRREKKVAPVIEIAPESPKAKAKTKTEGLSGKVTIVVGKSKKSNKTEQIDAKALDQMVKDGQRVQLALF